MARVCVVGNATHDLIRAGLIADRRPGGTLLYASLALDALGHDVQPAGNAPLRAYWTLRFAGIDRSNLSLAFPGTRFLNKYEEGRRTQWAREGPGRAIDDASILDDADGILLGPVLGEVPAELEVPEGVPCVLDVQGLIRSLGSSNVWGYQRVEVKDEAFALPDSTHVCASIEELEPLADTSDPETAARWLAEQARRPTVVTMGARGAMAVDGQTRRARLDPVPAEDPTGAGDVFDAGLLHGLLEGASLDRCLAIGCAAAGLFLEREDERRLVDRFASLEAVEERADEAVLEP